MADEQLIKPRELPAATTVFADDAIMTDNGSIVGKATPVQLVNAGAPVPTEAEAIAGADNSKRMTPLTVKQVLDNVTAPSVMRAAAWAESGTQPDPGIPGSKSAKSWAAEAERLGSEQADRAEAAAAEVAAASATYFPDVAALMADEREWDVGTLLSARVEDFNFKVAPTSATDYHYETAGGVKLYEAGPRFSSLSRALRGGALKIFEITGYHAGSGLGGGVFVYNPIRSKTHHDGGTVIDPDRTFPPDWTNQTQFSAWFVGSTTGYGVYERQHKGVLTDYDFGASENSTTLDHDAQILVMCRSASSGGIITLHKSPYRLSNTITADATMRGASIVGIVQSDGFYTKILRGGTVDTHRACFRVTTTGTFFDKLYLYAEDGFSERAGIVYNLGAGFGNRIGHLQGSYWRLGVVYSQLTGPEFELTAQKITALYEGRAYSSDSPSTPAGNVRISAVQGICAGFVDVSGGSVEIDSLVIERARVQLFKKGNQAPGGVIKIGRVTAKDCIVETRLEFACDENLEGVMAGVIFTGETSGATGKLLGSSRYRVDLIDTVGDFVPGETVTASGGYSVVVTTVTNWTAQSSGIEGAIGNAGDNFDLIDINEVYIDKYHGDPLWILNNGKVNIGRVVARNIWGGRHLFRYTPDVGGGPDPNYLSRLTVGSFEVYDAEMINNSTYTPIFIRGDGRAEVGIMVLDGVVAAGRTNFFDLGMPTQIGNLFVKTTGGNFSRFILASPGIGNVSIVSNAILKFDSANRIGQVFSGELLIGPGKHTAASAFDGDGVATLTSFTPF